jgi:hypothetical protein
MIVSAQETKNWKDEIQTSVYGYVKLDAFYDTRETVNGREGHFLLWPSAPSFDADGNDKAAHGSFNMLAVQSMFGIKVKGPEILKAKTSAVIEGDFFGQNNDNVNLLRLRHAYFQMKWNSTDLLVGQYWNPVFNFGAFPTTVSFTTGTPILPFSRNPQIRVTQHLGNFTLIGVVLSQRDYASYGPNPENLSASISSSEFLKNSGIPEFHGKLTYKIEKDKWSFGTGAGAGYKQIMPRVLTETGYVTSQTVPGISATVYFNLSYGTWRLKGGAVYGNNATDVMSLGGFAVSAVTDTIRNYYEYTSLSSYSVWGDISKEFDSWNVGVFAGRVKQIGSDDEIVGNTWGIGNNIAYIYKVSPRVWYQKKAVRIALEIEYTAAGFGEPDNYGIPQNVQEVANTRFLLGVYYFFK